MYAYAGSRDLALDAWTCSYTGSYSIVLMMFLPESPRWLYHKMAGFKSNEPALFLSLVVAALNAAGTILGIYLIDIAGRKKLVIGSLSGVVGTLILLSVSCIIIGNENKRQVFGWLVIAGLGVYILFFTLGMGPVPWTMNSEIYPE
ncbi:hypothetical protein Ahy_B09g099459 [Arachis hypogaea]|uniref:Major facilitator superfamily (MFS) profile domain-containing protein n=1 Tax=Arachis hypogaea TaxID=3818 RepID=A0A444XTS8_ARAHY|nr:hypothetical protein Ahy_B09g099459 [Arachis hypogaea]